jgi:hypothetical protein
VEVEHIAHVIVPAMAVERGRVTAPEPLHPAAVVRQAERVVRGLRRGREEERRSLPVVVHEHLRLPAADLHRHLARLRLAHGQRVSVGIELVVRATAADAPRLRALLLERPRFGIALPVRVDPGDEALVAVGIVRGVHEHHGVVEQPARERVLAGHQLVGHLHHGLERRRLVAVDAVVEPHRHRGFARELLQLCCAHATRVGELRIGLANGVEPRQVLRARDDEQRTLARLHRAPERLAAHAVGTRARDGVQHALHVAPRRVERAGGIAEHVGRARHTGLVRAAVIEIEAHRRGLGSEGYQQRGTSEARGGEAARECGQEVAAHAGSSRQGAWETARESAESKRAAAARAVTRCRALRP